MKTEVAVGVVFREDGAVLVGQRLQGKPYAGWWEFPGGKFEAGENAAEALARELREELGIRVLESRPWVVREHVYEHAHVRLHFRRVVRWEGEVRSCEGQAFVWQQPDAVDVEPLLPAAIAPIAWLGLPEEYAISNAAELGVEGFLACLARRLDGQAHPLKLLQLREPDLTAADFQRLFDAVARLVQAGRSRLLISSRHPQRYWQMAADMTGGGVHLTARDLHQAGAPGGLRRPALPLVGASCHDAADLALAGTLGIDFAVLGPVRATLSHPQATLLGWGGFNQLVASSPVPVYALGGVSRADLDCATRHGAHGVAAQRSAWAE